MFGSLLFILLLAAGVCYWWDSARAHEATIVRARQVCAEAQVQLLDYTVALAKLRGGRDARGQFQLQRWYQFDFSTNGTDRHRGMAALRGAQVEFIRLEMPDGAVIHTAQTIHRIQ